MFNKGPCGSIVGPSRAQSRTNARPGPNKGPPLLSIMQKYNKYGKQAGAELCQAQLS